MSSCWAAKARPDRAIPPASNHFFIVIPDLLKWNVLGATDRATSRTVSTGAFRGQVAINWVGPQDGGRTAVRAAVPRARLPRDRVGCGRHAARDPARVSIGSSPGRRTREPRQGPEARRGPPLRGGRGRVPALPWQL